MGTINIKRQILPWLEEVLLVEMWQGDTLILEMRRRWSLLATHTAGQDSWTGVLANAKANQKSKTCIV